LIQIQKEGKRNDTHHNEKEQEKAARFCKFPDIHGELLQNCDLDLCSNFPYHGINKNALNKEKCKLVKKGKQVT